MPKRLVWAIRVISVPAQLSLVAHGNPAWYEALSPAITCYATPLAEIGRAAATAILNHIAESTDRLTPTAPAVTKLHGDIRTRGSLAEPNR